MQSQLGRTCTPHSLHTSGQTFSDEFDSLKQIENACDHLHANVSNAFPGALVHTMAWGGCKHKTLLDTGCSFESVTNGKVSCAIAEVVAGEWRQLAKMLKAAEKPVRETKKTTDGEHAEQAAKSAENKITHGKMCSAFGHLASSTQLVQPTTRPNGTDHASVAKLTDQCKNRREEMEEHIEKLPAELQNGMRVEVETERRHHPQRGRQREEQRNGGHHAQEPRGSFLF